MTVKHDDVPQTTEQPVPIKAGNRFHKEDGSVWEVCEVSEGRAKVRRAGQLMVLPQAPLDPSIWAKEEEAAP